jgi:ABC-2 type transport system ATP-binding protein
MEPIIEIKGLTKDYEKGFWKKRRTRALNGLDLTVEPGQIFGFLGGNGAGKTTTIKLLMSLIFPTAGTAKILGRDINDVSMHQKIGYCPEHPYFYDYLKASELMDYFGQLFGLNAADRKARTHELLTRTGLDHKDWNKQLRKFSKGMLQRVGLAQCLINDPEIVFLDEPMSGLDPRGRRQVRELIGELREEGKTVFMSSHILTDIEALCDNVAILREGNLVETGNLDELLRASGAEAGFEISIKGVSETELKNALGDSLAADFSVKPNGLTANVKSESDVSAVLEAVQRLDGKLIGVNQIKQSLEELFVKEELS